MNSVWTLGTTALAFLSAIAFMGAVAVLNWLFERLRAPLPMTCREFAEALLKESGFDYEVFTDGSDTPARCDWKKKRLYLSYSSNNRSLPAVFQAAHEVGHAVHAPTFFGRHPHVFWGVYLAALLVSVFGGWTGNLASWRLVLSLMGTLFLFRTLDFWFDELRAIRYARSRLEKLTGDGMALKLFTAANHTLVLVIPVAFSVALACAGRLFWCLGGYLGGDATCLDAFLRPF